jgi:serine O-acetyltransferase
MNGTISEAIHQLHALRGTQTKSVPNSFIAASFVERTLALLFPHFSSTSTQAVPELQTVTKLQDLANETVGVLEALIAPVVASREQREGIVSGFITSLPSLHKLLLHDAQALFDGDPAAESVDEVIIAYPGFFAIAVFRIANWLHIQAVPIAPRLLTEYAHRITGVDIHPGATIGRSFVIDHGTGIVIGETTVIKDRVKIYQGVTLGALSVDKTLANTKRHPTIESDVVIYANATILGGETVIGMGTVVGGNVWITASVPANSRVYHRGEIVVKSVDVVEGDPTS